MAASGTAQGEFAAGGAGRPQAFTLSPLLKASAGAHLAAAGAIAIDPAWWPWLGTAILANHALIGTAGLLPRSRLLGENWTRLPAAHAARAELCLTIDDGPDAQLTPRLLEILARSGARASFFVIGERAARHGPLLREMIRCGHSVENHTWDHPAAFAAYGPARMRREIARAQQAIADATGTAPRFFRPPAGLRNVLMYPVLARLGLIHASWTRRGFDAVSASAGTVHARLARRLAARDILLLHDGHPGPGKPGRALCLEVLPRLLEDLGARGLRSVPLTAGLAGR